MPTRPLASIVVPTFNGQPYLRQCLQSALAQDTTDFEILIVDDGSSDQTLKIAEEFAAGDNRVRVTVNDQNLGLVGNWNRCIEEARGEWIKFLFQDDWLEPNFLTAMLAAGNRPLVICDRDFVFEEVSNLKRQNYEQILIDNCPRTAFGDATSIDTEVFCRAVLRYGHRNFLGEPTSMLIRKDVFERYGTFDSRYVQLCDLELMLRVGVQEGITYVPKRLASFRVHEQSTTSNNQRQRAFAKNVLDPLLLYEEFATNPMFANLRLAAERDGQDLLKQFQNRLMGEMRWGQYWNHPDWSRVTSENPNFRLPLLHRVKRRARLLLEGREATSEA